VVIITYEMSYRIANTSWLQLAFSGVLIAAVCRFHASLQQVILVQLVLLMVLLALVGVPFLRDALRNAEPFSAALSPAVRLIRRISEDEVIGEFLLSDFENPAYSDYQVALRSIVMVPNYEDANENAKRRALLFLRHFSLWKEIPPDTEWFEVEVKEAELDRIQVFPRAHWRKIARGNFVITNVVEHLQARHNKADSQFLEKIAAVRARLVHEQPLAGSVVLIGLNESEPFTVIDGNHRLVAAVLENRVHRLRFVCGLSPKMSHCCWYRTNLLTLTRYGQNQLRQLTHRPEVELARLFENSG
jgi:hypothetical protein